MADRLLTQQELAEVLPITSRQIRNLVKEGMPQETLGARTLYPLAACVRWYIAHREAIASGQRTNRSEAQARKTEAQARLAELEVEEAEGRLIPLALHQDRLAAILDRLRAKILAIPGTWPPRLIRARTVAEMMRSLKPLVHELIEALAATADDVEDAA